jgi:MHS family shikimate/dehydroshikimate transporter-like MFS transporter
VTAASTVGTAIEWYDFYLYSTAAALVLGPLFFPSENPAAGTLAAFATYAAGFAARPLGGVLFGHFGDRVGRKYMLVLTLLIMGLATFVIGLLPTYEQAGVWAPVLLVALRVLQGLGIGGEWGGAILMTTEHAPPERRGLFGSWPQMGFPLGFLGGIGAFALVGRLPEEQFLAWGWRVPFLFSILLVAVGLFIRLKVTETPAFERMRRTRGVARMPLAEAFRQRPKEMLLGTLAALGHGIIVTIFTVYLLSYASGEDGAGRAVALNGLMIAAALQCVAVPLFGALSDRVGRRPVLLFGYLVSSATVFPALAWLRTNDPLLVALTFVLAMSIGHGAAYGTISTFLVELFGTRSRMSGLSFTYQMGSTASAFGPLLAAALVASAGAEWPVGALFVACSVLAFLAVLLAGETSKSDLSELAGEEAGRHEVTRGETASAG